MAVDGTHRPPRPTAGGRAPLAILRAPRSGAVWFLPHCVSEHWNTPRAGTRRPCASQLCTASWWSDMNTTPHIMCCLNARRAREYRDRPLCAAGDARPDQCREGAISRGRESGANINGKPLLGGREGYNGFPIIGPVKVRLKREGNSRFSMPTLPYMQSLRSRRSYAELLTVEKNTYVGGVLIAALGIKNLAVNTITFPYGR